MDILERGAGVQRIEAHLAVVIEVVDGQVGDHHRWAAPGPALLARIAAASAPLPRLPGEVRKSMRSTNERFDWRMTTKTSRALMAISQAPPEPGSRVRGRGVVADDGGVDVAEAVDLRGAQEAHVDQAALEVAAEQVDHRHHRGGARDDGGVTDRQRQPGGPGTVGAGLVDELAAPGPRSGAPG